MLCAHSDTKHIVFKTVQDTGIVLSIPTLHSILIYELVQQ